MQYEYNHTAGIYHLYLGNKSIVIDPKLDRSIAEDGWNKAKGIALNVIYSDSDWTVTERLES